MFWDTVAPLYNLFENIYNGKVNKQVQAEVAALIAPSDRVLECACGAGMLSVPGGRIYFSRRQDAMRYCRDYKGVEVNERKTYRTAPSRT